MGDPAVRSYTIRLGVDVQKSFGNRIGRARASLRKMRRELAIEIMGEATPGPGAYNGGDMMRTGKVAALAALDSGEKMPRSSFKSKSKQREEPEGSTVPGAGAYSPNHMMTLDSRMSVNAGASMRGKGARFVGASKLERDQSVEPGPGAYETEILRTGGKSSLSAYDTGEMMPSAAFASDSIRQMPWPETNGAGSGRRRPQAEKFLLVGVLRADARGCGKSRACRVIVCVDVVPFSASKEGRRASAARHMSRVC